jgi:hypothetical protein
VEYIRRRRMTVAAANVIGRRELLGTAVRFGFGSTEAFNRAFRAVHGGSPADVRRDGGPRVGSRETIHASCASCASRTIWRSPTMKYKRSLPVLALMATFGLSLSACGGLAIHSPERRRRDGRRRCSPR